MSATNRIATSLFGCILKQFKSLCWDFVLFLLYLRDHINDIFLLFLANVAYNE